MRDMKYLSNSNQTTWTTTDSAVMAGTQPMSVELNFNDLLSQDASGETYYVVGGRVYYEATVSGVNTNTFITRGFFDQQGYVQPAKQANISGILIGVAVGVVAVVLVVLFCCWRKKKQDELDGIKGVLKDIDKVHAD